MTIQKEQKLKKIEEEVLDTKDENYFSKYLIEARQLISDIKYFEEHIKRTRISKRFSLEVFPSYQGVIMDWFVKNLFFEDTFWRFNEDEVILRLKIYDITYTIFDKINHYDKNRSWSIDRKWIKKAIEWNEVLKYFTGKEMKDIIHNFIGSNYSINEIRKVWEEVEKNNLIVK